MLYRYQPIWLKILVFTVLGQRVLIAQSTNILTRQAVNLPKPLCGAQVRWNSVC